MKVECWLVVKGTSGTYAGNYPSGHPYAGQRRIDRMRVVKIAQNKPQCAEDEVAFKAEFDVDEGWFLEGIAKITATIPAPQKGAEIQATVEMPVKGRAPSAAASVVRHP